MGKRNISVMITAFRDGFQSVYGARVFTKDFMPAVEAAREAGVNHFEAGGGARFQALYFYSNEDAFEMMDSFRRAAGPEANLQSLARGVNVVGLESQSSDVIKLHATLFKKHGITTVRNFDALNDVGNLIYSGRCIYEAGLKHEVVVTLMSLPPGIAGGEKVHTAEYYVGVLRKILAAEIPYHSVCFKDASGTATPKIVYDTIKSARKILPQGTKIVFHTHDTAGTGTVCYQAALDGGVDGIDLSMAPVSGGSCQPDVLTMWHALRGTEYDLGIDFDKMRRAEEVFKECMQDYFLPPESKAVDPLTPLSPMPGGALTANSQMMRDNNLMHRFGEVINAMRDVVARGGYGTSVTPVSQFYFQQAFNNVMFGPWKKIADGYGKMVLGYFGRTPLEPDPEVVKTASEQLGLAPTKTSPLVINDADPKKGTEAACRMLEEEGLPVNDENIFIAATCREKGILYLKGKGTIGVRKEKKEQKQKEEGPKQYAVTVDSAKYHIALEGNTAIVNGKTYRIDVSDKPEDIAAIPLNATNQSAVPANQPIIHQPASVGVVSNPASGDLVDINAELPGLVIKIYPQEGAEVNMGAPIFLLESMKMEVTISAPNPCTLTFLAVAAGDQITAGQLLAQIRPLA